MKTGMYPPSLSFTVVYDTALKYNGRGRPSMVKLFCEGTTEGRLQFNSVVYEEKGKTYALIDDTVMCCLQEQVTGKSPILPLTCHHLIEDQGGEARGAGSLSLQGNNRDITEKGVTGP